MTEVANPLEKYFMRTNTIEAVEVDKYWFQYLTKEKGFTKVNIGDYFLIGNDGEQVMPKAQFERLFYKP